MGAAIGWGSLAASSLVLGALIGVGRRWPAPWIGRVLAFGAGALIAAVSFELAQEGIAAGGLEWVAAGLAVGALTYFVLNGLLNRGGEDGRGRRGRAAKDGRGRGRTLLMGSLLDGIPEQLVLGVGLALGEGVSVGLIVGIFVSNVPEAMGSVDEMAGRSKGRIVGLWVAVAAVCALATVGGYALADVVTGEARAVINGFAAGALVVMLVDSLFPEMEKDSPGRVAGLFTTLGFAVATALSTLT